MRKKGWKLMLRAGPLLLLLLVGTGLNAHAFLGLGNSVSWKEEVQLHDGRKIIVERSQTHGGRHELGQPLPIKDHSVTFSLPGAGKTITWEDKYSQDIGVANFKMLALHIANNTSYIITAPVGCLAYNKWGRPNPPYVIFRYDGKGWQRIQLAELPVEFKEMNLAIDTFNDERKLLAEGLVSAEMIKKLNSSYSKYPNIRSEYQTILRTPSETGKNSASNVDCEVMIPNGRNGWAGFDVSSIHSYGECMQVCKFHNLSKEFCPCDDLLKTKPEWR